MQLVASSNPTLPLVACALLCPCGVVWDADPLTVVFYKAAVTTSFSHHSILVYIGKHLFIQQEYSFPESKLLGRE